MPLFAHAHTDDPLSLATEDDIVLVGVREVLGHGIVDLLGEKGLYVTGSDAVKRIEGVYTLTTTYELKSTALAFNLNADIGGYRVQNVSVNCTSRTFPQVTITSVKPGNGSFCAVLAGGVNTVTISGGFGMVNLWGATCTEPISSTMNIGGQTAMAIAGTSGEILTLGLAVYGWKKSCTLEGYVLPTLGDGTYQSEGTDDLPVSARDGMKTYSKGWQADLAFAVP